MNLKEKLINFFEPPVVEKIRGLIRISKELGLPDRDVHNAEEMLLVNEGGLAFDTVAAQMYEFEVPVTDDFLRLAKEIMIDMQIDEKKYEFLSKLPRNGSVE